MSYTVSFLSAMSQIETDVWDTIASNATPFMQHAFLNALETSGCVQPQTGWQPHHMLVSQHQRLVAVLPLYVKYHSFGEYVFDSEWARAYQAHGLRYYPKLLSAVPFTPITGPRLAIIDAHPNAPVVEFVVEQIKHLCQAQGYSSWHCLFTPKSEIDDWKHVHLISRTGVQFHWVNPGYETFDHYLSTMNSKRRKTIKRERRRIKEQGITHHWHNAVDLSSADWQDVYDCYAATYLKRGQAPYLNQMFFQQIAELMPHNMLCLMARRDDKLIACALFFVGGSTLYGRYWGSLEDNHSLHFETCYYQGIEYAIEQGLRHFDAGAQGEHKISRGFHPTETYSWHWIQMPAFRAAIEQFAGKEAELVSQYQANCEVLLPFKTP